MGPILGRQRETKYNKKEFIFSRVVTGNTIAIVNVKNCQQERGITDMNTILIKVKKDCYRNSEEFLKI
jgi:hypothetical protein